MKTSHCLWLASALLVGCAAAGEDAKNYTQFVSDGSGGFGCLNPQAVWNKHTSRTIQVTITDNWSSAGAGSGVNNLNHTLGPSEKERFGCQVTGGGGTPSVNHQFKLARADFVN